MATLKTATVDSFNKDFNFIEWEFADPVPTGNKSIEIYRSEVPGESLSEFDLITTLAITEGNYIDNGIDNLYVHNRKWFYQLNLVDNDTLDETILLSQPVTSDEGPRDYAAREILYRKKLSLERFTQRSFYLLKRRTWGTHCSACWDETLFRSSDPNCPVCYGTGWEMGYFSPIKFEGMANPSPTYNQLLPFAKWKPSDSLLTMLNFPYIIEGDILVDDEGSRWIVVQKRPMEKLGRVIEQRLQISIIQPDDIVYTIPVTPEEPSNLVTFLDTISLVDENITYPTYTDPTLTLSDNGNTTISVETGTTLSNAALTPIWAQNDAGLLESYKIYKNSVFLVNSQSGFAYDIPEFTIGTQVITYYSIAEYGNGAIKNDSSGEPYPIGRIMAGSIQSNDVIYRGSRAVFGAVDGSITDIRSLSTKILDGGEGTIFNFTGVSGATVVIAYPDTYRDLTEAVFSSGGFDFNILDQFIRQADQQVNDASGGNPITYKVFKYEPVLSFNSVDISVTI